MSSARAGQSGRKLRVFAGQTKDASHDMIFGFNTDIKYADTVYHVQSEARVADLLLQTQVFVRGRCVGKLAASYAGQATRPEFSESEIHELLKQQHRFVLDTVREGRVETLFAGAGVQDAGGQGLTLEWLNAASWEADGPVRLRFLVTREGKPIAGARLTSRLAMSDAAPIHSAASTAADGTAELVVVLHDPAAREPAVLIQATHAGASASRKFRLRR